MLTLRVDVCCHLHHVYRIGFNDREREAGCTGQGNSPDDYDIGFVWADGSEVDFTKWSSGEPNDWQDGTANCDGEATVGEDCSHFFPLGAWNDAMCGASAPYVCGYCADDARRRLAEVDTETCVPCQPGTYDHDDNAGSGCEPCPRSTYQDAEGTTSCTTCPGGMVSDMGSAQTSNCTTEILYVGCFEDRETFVDGRDLIGARFRMGSDASVETCQELCAGWRYMGLQSIDQCFCDNTYGTYEQLDLDPDADLVCGMQGSVCGQNNTAFSSDPCRMINAVFLLPYWTCSEVSCDAGTAAIASAAHASVLGQSDADSQASCCGTSCEAWHAGGGNACADGTRFMTRLSETVVAGSDPQATCCTAPCTAGTYDDGGRCEPCPAGTVSTTVDATACSECAAGQYAAPQTASCASCGAGLYDHDQSAATPCESCAPGMYSARVDTVSCDGECPVGTFGAAGAQSSDDCAQCQAGQHDHDRDAATPCLLCLPGFFSESAGQSECQACAAGLTSVGGSATCSQPQPAFAAANCPAEWAACLRASGCEQALAEALATPWLLRPPTTGSAELLAVLECMRAVTGGATATSTTSSACNCNYQLISTPMNWMDAEESCVLKGGHLASVHSQQDQDILHTLIGTAALDTAWIGYNDREAEAGCTDGRHVGIGVGNVLADSFVWVDGSPSGFENWASGSPQDWQDGAAHCDGTGNEDCTGAWRGGQDWDDSACTALKPFVCGFPCEETAEAQTPGESAETQMGDTGDWYEYQGCYVDCGDDQGAEARLSYHLDGFAADYNPATTSCGARQPGDADHGCTNIGRAMGEQVMSSPVAATPLQLAASQDICATWCKEKGFRYMGLHWTNVCYCDNEYADAYLPEPHPLAMGCGVGGTYCGTGYQSCGCMIAVFTTGLVEETAEQAQVSAEMLGCVDPLASNYDATKAINDGSCVYDCSTLSASADTQCYIYSPERNAWESHPPQREAVFWAQLTAAHHLVVQGKSLRHIGAVASADAIVASNCDYYLNEDPLSWVEAEAACVAMGGHLASAHSPEDWASIEFLIPNTAWCAALNAESAC